MTKNLTEQEVIKIKAYLHDHVKTGSAFKHIAEDMGMSQQVLHNAYRGEIISDETLRKILAYYKVTTRELCGVDIPYFEVDLSDIGERIKTARIDKGLTVHEMVEETGLSYASYIGYERGRCIPSRFRLEDIADVLELTDKQLLTFPLLDEDEIRWCVKAIRSNLGLTVAQFSQLIGVSGPTIVTNWEKGDTHPRLRTVRNLLREIDLTLYDLGAMSYLELKRHCEGITFLMTAEDKLEWLMNKYNVEKIGLRPDRDFKAKGV